MKRGRVLQLIVLVVAAIVVLGAVIAQNSEVSAKTGREKFVQVHDFDHIDVRFTTANTLVDQNGLKIVTGDLQIPEFVTVSKITGVRLIDGANSQNFNMTSTSVYESRFERGINVKDEDVNNIVLEIGVTFSNGENKVIRIDKDTNYPDSTYIQYDERSNFHNRMLAYGIEIVEFDGTRYFDVSNRSILDIARICCEPDEYPFMWTRNKNLTSEDISCWAADFILNATTVFIHDKAYTFKVRKEFTNIDPLSSIVPKSIDVELYEKEGDVIRATGQKVTLSAENDWEGSVEYAKFEGIEYFFKEVGINGESVDGEVVNVENYTSTDGYDNGYGTYVIENTYNNDNHEIYGSKTFNMGDKRVNDVPTPVINGNPKIDLEVTKICGENEVKLNPTDYTVSWTGTDEDKWSYTISGSEITRYYDSDNDGDLDSEVEYQIKESNTTDILSEDGLILHKISIDGFEYFVAYNGNDITNTLDDSKFTGNIVINKSINDVNINNGQAIFTYLIEKSDEYNNPSGIKYYAVIAIEEGSFSGTTKLVNLPLGNYKVTELQSMRYSQVDISNGGNVQVTRNSENEVSFSNERTYKDNLSHTDLVVNHFGKNGENVVEYTKYEYTTSAVGNAGN